MKFNKKIRKAIEKSAFLHRNQKRKGSNIPYIAHPFSVALIASQYTNDENIIIAALLHDVLEDSDEYSFKNLREEFGKKVADIVEGASEDSINKEKSKKETWKKRKESYLSKLENDSEEAMIVCCADKIHNITCLIEGYKKQKESLWEKFNASKEDKMWYYEEVAKIIKKRLKNEIKNDLEEKIEELKSLLEYK